MGKYKRSIQSFTSKKLGCQIITVPLKIIETIENFGKSFDELTKDTVKVF